MQARYGFLALILAACGPSASGGGDDTSMVDSGHFSAADGGDITLADGAAPPPVIIYAHTKDTLYTVNRPGFDVTMIGKFNTAPADDITDLAVTPSGNIYALSSTKL